MSWDAQELAEELLERFSIATVDGGQADRDAVSYLLQRYPLSAGTAAAWRAFLEGVANLLNALPIEAAVAAELRQLLSNAEKEAQPDREALRQYIDLGFSLYSQCETQDGRRKFCDWQGGREWNKNTARIARLEELDAALKAGIRLFSFLPSEKGFVCIDVDCGHEKGGDGWLSYYSFLKARGIEGDPLSEARVIVDTPSGGNHLYFLTRGDGIRHEAKLCDNVEAFGTGCAKPLTAAGSVKKGKVYVLHGRLSDATVIPRKLNNWLAKRAVTEQAQPSAQGAGKARFNQTRRYADYSLEERVSYHAAKVAGRNNGAYEAALCLGWQAKEGRFTEAELYAAIKAHPELGQLPDKELRPTFQSGFERSEKQQ